MDAITREKEIKAWRREKKLALIAESNPDWLDLAEEWSSEPGIQACASDVEAKIPPSSG